MSNTERLRQILGREVVGRKFDDLLSHLLIKYELLEHDKRVLLEALKVAMVHMAPEPGTDWELVTKVLASIKAEKVTE